MTTKHETSGKSAAGQKGVSGKNTVAAGKDKDQNNFANDPERAAAAGRKGGKSSH